MPTSDTGALATGEGFALSSGVGGSGLGNDGDSDAAAAAPDAAAALFKGALNAETADATTSTVFRLGGNGDSSSSLSSPSLSRPPSLTWLGKTVIARCRLRSSLRAGCFSAMISAPRVKLLRSSILPSDSMVRSSWMIEDIHGDSCSDE